MSFTRDSLDIDPVSVAAHLAEGLRTQVLENLRRKGGVVAVSGGVDSAVAASLAARALGPERVLGLILPERDVEGESETLAQDLLDDLGVHWVKEDLTAGLESLGCYRRRDEAIRRIVPEYEDGWTSRIVVGHNPLESEGFNIFFLEVFPPGGVDPVRRRLPLSEYLDIVAATNMKQRSRMLMEYYYAEKLRYAVIGTHNRTEYDLGFMVRYGDIGVDIHPLLGLYKMQIYQLASCLGIPEAITGRAPSSGTFSAPQTEQEFFFGLPFELLDPLLHAEATGVPIKEATAALGLSFEAVERVYLDIRSKRRSTDYMRREPAALSVWRPIDGEPQKDRDSTPGRPHREITP